MKKKKQVGRQAANKQQNFKKKNNEKRDTKYIHTYIGRQMRFQQQHIKMVATENSHKTII